MAGSTAATTSTGQPTARRLKDVLTRLAMPAEALLVERRKPSEDGPGLFRLVLREIDETVLPRRLELHGAGATVATMMVSNRMLAGIRLSPTADVPVDDAASAPRGVARRFAATLLDLGATADRLTVRPRGDLPRPETGGTACSAAQIATASDALGDPCRLRTFLETIKPRLAAWHFCPAGGQDAARGGPKDLLQRLNLLRQSFPRNHAVAGAVSRIERQAPCCRAAPLPSGLQAIIASDGDDTLLAALTDEAAAAVIVAWRRIYAKR